MSNSAREMSPDRWPARVREYLGVTLAQQTAWRDADEALKEWRRALHRVGIFVFKDAFREESFSGFSLYDDVFPIIYVNNSVPETRQIFTLFHELGHLLFHTSGIDPRNDESISSVCPKGPGTSKCYATASPLNFSCRKKCSRRPLRTSRQPNELPKFSRRAFMLAGNSSSANSSTAT